MKTINYRYFAYDFETTVFEGQEDTQVWSASCCEFNTEDVKIFHSIGEFIDYLISLKHHVCCYFHNLKFDGSFILSYFLINLGYKNAINIDDEEKNIGHFDSGLKIKANHISYSISSQGQWYRIQTMVNSNLIEFRDSLKLMPFKLEDVGKSFETLHRKLEMEYKGFRFPGCEITKDEQSYIENDCLVLKEAMEKMFSEGHKKLTIGSCCLSEYRRTINSKHYDNLFPNVYNLELDKSYGAVTVGDYVHKSYKGGWCYLVKGKERRLYTNGITLDVNSLYPSMMHSQSGNVFPVGLPTFWQGDYIPEEALKPTNYYFIRIRTRFKIKPGKLPFIQMKSTFMYRPTEMLETSDIYNPDTGEYSSSYIDFDGQEKPALVELTLTCTDWILLKDHYNLTDCTILDGCYFKAQIGLFDEYIDKYKQQKINSTGAKRTLAKLFSNNLYGKMAASPVANFKVAFVKEDFSLGFRTMQSTGKQPGYIPVGSAITSYARNFTIRAAQANFYGADKPGFIYSDTDSIHLDLPLESVKGVQIDKVEYGKWKHERSWNEGWFLRQKTYAEKDDDGWELKCAGMSDRCKQLLVASMEGQNIEVKNEAEKEFMKERRTIQDFDIGLTVPGKLTPKRIRGGVLLVDDVFTIRA